MSSARRRQLGSWLTKLRQSAGFDVEDAGTALGCSASKVRHLEAGRSKIKRHELVTLLDLYGADQDVRKQLDETRQQAEQRGWWESYRVPSWFEPFVDFESFATEAVNFELDLIPGLLQTEAYAYEIHRAGRYTTNPVDISRRVQARAERQKRLTELNPLRLRAVVNEAALRREVGGPAVMAEQLDQVMRWCELSNVIVQVLPYGAGAHASPSGAFALLSFDNNEAVGFLDTPLGGHTVDDPNDVEALKYVGDELRSTALPAPTSFELIRSIREAHTAQT
ncbi:helix-turn-helix domain-containing protein [Actinopolyspora saharensis]|uniref:Helix-turn-helix domain-containing protein n=1 Tax=Actinopolyspora saharensis TaxID=995062 RepID=A0A1H0YD39_9ACTN|nr:helix-turn-helix transcriptional regulator [Actinopolyspora saharensis]SDQ12871.1 Helix-turn-helix domain-containing protein [Actinopolyspora saharensis]